MRERFLTEPDHVRRESVGRLKRGTIGIAARQNVTAGDIHFMVEGDGHRLADLGSIEVMFERNDAVDLRRATGVGNGYRIPGRDRTGHDGSGVTTEVAFRAHNELHRKTKTCILACLDRFPVLEELDQRGPGVPGHIGGALRHVIDSKRTDGDRDHLRNFEAGGCGAHNADDLFEGGMVVPDEIHLVHRDHHGSNAHQSRDGEMSVGLRAHAAVSIHQENRNIAIRGRHRHVAGVLLVAGGVGNKNPATIGQVHVPVGDVDRDALLTLGFETIGQE